MNGTDGLLDDMRLLQNGKKFLIGLWLGTTAITLALILHVGRCSVKAADSVNTVISEITEFSNKFVSLPSTVVGLVKDVTQKGEQEMKEEEEKGNKNDIEDVEKGSVRKDSARDQRQFESDDIELITHEKTEHPNSSDEADLQGDDVEKGSVKENRASDLSQFESDDAELATHQKTEHPSASDEVDLHSEGSVEQVLIIFNPSPIPDEIWESDTLPEAAKILSENSLEQVSESDKQTDTGMPSLLSYKKLKFEDSLEQVSEAAGLDEKSKTQIPSITPESHKKTEHSEAKIAIDENMLEELSVLEKRISKPALSPDPLLTLDRMMNKFTLNGNGHPFEFFTKSLQKIFTSSIILLLGFLGYDIYIYVTYARKQSYDWFILFPFPFWFSLVAIINCFAFIITESFFYYKNKKENVLQANNAPRSCTRIVCKYSTDFVITISATTFPVFIFFHLFWLIIASSAFAIRIVTSITFYIPLAIFIIWFLSVTSSILETWKKLLTNETARRSKGGTCKRVLHNIHLFLRPLIPFLFLPFWTLLLGTLHFFSDFLLNVVDLENQSLLVLFGLIIVIVGTTLKLAKSCKPKLDD